MKNAILLMIALDTISGLQSQVLMGTITDGMGIPIPKSRVTLFNIEVHHLSSGYYHAVIILNNNRTISKGIVKF